MDTTHKSEQLVWITGASSGIGRSLAMSFAGDGYRVAVTARNVEALNELASEFQNIMVFPGDVTDAVAMEGVVKDIEDKLGAIDLAILNAGVYARTNAVQFDPDKVRDTMTVNYFGVVNTLAPVMKAMVWRNRGHIALLSSVASYRGLPRASAYAPTKAALTSLGESLYGDLKANGVRMTVIHPGFIATPMTAPAKFNMPFIIPVEEAVRIIRRGLEKPRFEIVFPWQTAVLMKIMRAMPYRLFFWTIARMAAATGADQYEDDDDGDGDDNKTQNNS